MSHNPADGGGEQYDRRLGGKWQKRITINT
jgi:hypothetical protein